MILYIYTVYIYIISIYIYLLYTYLHFSSGVPDLVIGFQGKSTGTPNLFESI